MAYICDIFKIKSKLVFNEIFSLLPEKKKLSIVMCNKNIQKNININIINYKKVGRDKMAEYKKGIVKEYLNDTKIVIFEGEYLNGKRHGKGIEYYYNGNIKFKGEYKNGKIWNGEGYTVNLYYFFSDLEFKIQNGKGKIKEFDYFRKLIFEGEYFNGLRNGKGKEYYNFDLKKLKFEGKYLDGKIWDGVGYNYDNGNEEFRIIDGKGEVKEYNEKGELIFEGEYFNGLRNGKGKEYNKNRELKFIGEYKDGLRNGQGQEFYENEILLFKGEYLNGLRNGFGKEFYKNGKIIFEGDYFNGKRNGIGKEMDNNGLTIFKGEYSNGKRWNGTGSEYNGDYLEFKGLYFKGKRWNGTLIEYDWETNEIIYEGKILEGVKISE